jgi:hypothetical protein
MIPHDVKRLRDAVKEEIDRLERSMDDGNIPMGGWRNQAVENVARRESMNPYTLDGVICGPR